MPLNWSDCGEQFAPQVTGVSAEDPPCRRAQSNDAVPPPLLPRKATTPTRNGPASVAPWPAWPISVQVAPSSPENSPVTFVPS